MKLTRNKIIAGIALALAAFLTLGQTTIGILLAPVPALWTNAVSRTMGSHLRDDINILDYIPLSEHASILAQDGVSTYDVHTALTNAIADCPAYGCEIHFGRGFYKFNSTIELKKTVILTGEGQGMTTQTTDATRLAFPINTTGIIVHAYNTIGSGVQSPATTGADGTIIRNIRLDSSGGTSGYGIWCRVRCDINNVRVNNFGSDGIHIVAGAGGGGALEGNANQWSMYRVTSENNGGHGVFIDGADTNAGVSMLVASSTNDGWGFWDSSFLGNTHIGDSVADNGLGAFKSDDVNSTSIFIGCYSEGGEPASTILYPAQIFGGQHGAGFVGDGINQFAFRITGNSIAGLKSLQVGIDPPSLAVGARTAAATATFSGATLAFDWVLSKFDKNLNGVQLHAYISADNTVTYYFENPANNPAGTVDLALGTIYLTKMSP